MKPNDETDNANEHNTVKNPNWREADQLAIYKHDQGVELGSTKKQLWISGQSKTQTCDLWISSPVPWPLGHTASTLINPLWPVYTCVISQQRWHKKWQRDERMDVCTCSCRLCFQILVEGWVWYRGMLLVLVAHYLLKLVSSYPKYQHTNSPKLHSNLL